MIRAILNSRWLRRLLGRNTRVRCIAAWGCDNYADYILHFRGHSDTPSQTRHMACCKLCKDDMIQHRCYMSYLLIESIQENP